jgi:undecaprenyl-diphosphatase
MVVPLIFGKVLKDLISIDTLSYGESFLPLTVGFICAFFTGILACNWMIKLVKNSQLKYFSFYCFIIGIISIVFSL